jgi:hypothetical protein
MHHASAPPLLCGLCGREAGREDPIEAKPSFYGEMAPHLPAVIDLVAAGAPHVRAPTVRRLTVDGLLAYQRRVGAWETTHQARVHGRGRRGGSERNTHPRRVATRVDGVWVPLGSQWPRRVPNKSLSHVNTLPLQLPTKPGVCVCVCVAIGVHTPHPATAHVGCQ